MKCHLVFLVLTSRCCAWLQLASVAHGWETYTRGVPEYRMVRQEVFFPHRSAHKLLSNSGMLDLRRSLNMCKHGSIKPRRKSQSHEVVVVDTGTANCLADRVSSADTNLRAYGVNKSEYLSSSESVTARAGAFWHICRARWFRSVSMAASMCFRSRKKVTMLLYFVITDFRCLFSISTRLLVLFSMLNLLCFIPFTHSSLIGCQFLL